MVLSGRIPAWLECEAGSDSHMLFVAAPRCQNSQAAFWGDWPVN